MENLSNINWPHATVLCVAVLSVATTVITFVGILITGRYPWDKN